MKYTYCQNGTTSENITRRQGTEEQDQDYLALADTLAINRSTARSIIARYLREGRIEEQPRGGRLHVRFDADMTRCIQRIVDEDCTLSLRAINTELRRRMPEKPQLSSS